MIVKRLISAAFLFAATAATFAQQGATQAPFTEKDIEDRDQKANGISVGSPKMYDDSLLQQMLTAAEGRLSSLQAIDQTSILTRLGAVTGAQQQISGVAISAQGPPLPQIATTANGATNSVATTQNSSGTSSVTTAGAPSQNVVTTMPQFGPPASTVVAPSTSLPSSFSVSASDVLNEQMQLTYEIANLRLLMEGSLNDWYIPGGQMLTPKPRTTVGFPITISADKRYESAVAIVEAVVETARKADLSGGQDPPAVTALLPREKTYNVASITDSTVSIGAGMVTQLAGISGSFLWGRKTYYIVKDQDTVARTFDTGNPSQTGFLWEFRPVLGRKLVQSGMKQTFVQLAFPTPGAGGVVGQLKIRTYWRKYDRKSGLLKEVVAGSLRETDFMPVSVPDLKQSLAGVSSADLEDLGGGQMLVRLEGRFLGGTYVRVGMNILGTGTTGFTSEYRLVRFVAPITDLATKHVAVVSRDGTEMPVTIEGNAPKLSDIVAAPFTPLDETNSLLQIKFKSGVISPLRPLVLVVGGKVFGYSDAPLARGDDSLSIALPTAFLIANQEVIVKPLLGDDRADLRLKLFDAATESERLVYLNQDDNYVSYLLFGRGLKDIGVVYPAPDKTDSSKSLVTASALTPDQDEDTLQLVKIKATAIKQLKQVIFQRKKERPFVVSVPALPAAASATDKTSSDPKFAERVTVGADEATIVGDGLTAFDTVMFGKTPLTISDRSDKAIKLKGLVNAGVTAVAKTQEISLQPKAGRATKINLEVVSQKVETVAK